MQKGFQTVNLHGCASGTIATPIIGENENWWIGNDDTGIPAKGIEGPKGEVGPKGDKGDQGTTGSAGAKGDKGDKGDSGAQGPQGIQGPQGAQGIQGEQGATGEVDPAELERINGEITDINQSLNFIFTHTLLDVFLSGGNNKTVTLVDDKLINYRALCVFYNGEYRLLPTKLFAENGVFTIRSSPSADYSGYYFDLTVTYKNVTTIDLSRNNTATVAKIYGIK